LSVLIDQLEVPWSTLKVVRVLKNNLRPEIRHELLNVDSHGYVKRTPFRREVAEFVDCQTQSIESECESELDIEALSLVCWNCRKEGHRYQDCVSDRRVFCYGCGAANTYKPSCGKCSKNSKPGTSKSAYKPKTSSASRSQATMTD
ncbi:hypothetical protein KR215_004012, partial [Drosophila sulfurigaster]